MLVRDTDVQISFLQLKLKSLIPRQTLVDVLRTSLSCGDELMKVGTEAGRVGSGSTLPIAG